VYIAESEATCISQSQKRCVYHRVRSDPGAPDSVISCVCMCWRRLSHRQKRCVYHRVRTHTGHVHELASARTALRLRAWTRALLTLCCRISCMRVAAASARTALPARTRALCSSLFISRLFHTLSPLSDSLCGARTTLRAWTRAPPHSACTHTAVAQWCAYLQGLSLLY
jgi:hypothetical protein